MSRLEATVKLFQKKIEGSALEAELVKTVQANPGLHCVKLGFSGIGGTKLAHRVHGAFGEVANLMKLQTSADFFMVAESAAIEVALSK